MSDGEKTWAVTEQLHETRTFAVARFLEDEGYRPTRDETRRLHDAAAGFAAALRAAWPARYRVTPDPQHPECYVMVDTAEWPAGEPPPARALAELRRQGFDVVD